MLQTLNMAVMVFLAEFVAVVGITLFLTILAAALIIIAKVLSITLGFLTPLTWIIIHVISKLSECLQYNLQCFANLTGCDNSEPQLIEDPLLYN